MTDEHFSNLLSAEGLIAPEKLDDLAVDLLDMIEKDKESREERDARAAQTTEESGLDGTGKASAAFDGGSVVVHPLITEAAIDFSASVIKEIFPPAGPCRFQLIGKSTQNKVEKARRKANWLNYQTTKQMVEFRPDLEQVLTQCALTGAEYIKFWWDKRLERPRTEPVFSDKVLLPAASTSYLGAERKTHWQVITQDEFDRRVKSEMYADIDVGVAATPDRTQSEESISQMQGVDADIENIDGQRTVYETQIYLDLEEEGRFDPYLVSIDETSRKIVAIYRNWAPDDDESRAELLHMVEVGMIPWRGGFIGFKGLLGAIGTSATGALNALLDSAHIANMPGGMRLKQSGVQGETIVYNPGEWVGIDAPVGVSDIRNVAMAIPTNGPNPVLFQLLGFLAQTGKGVVNTTMEKLAEQNANAPVGTTLALIEQGMKVFSGIHARMHGSMEQMLRIVHRLNRDNLSTEDVVDETGEVTVTRKDFQGPVDVAPVSDPSIFSETQRLAQIQAVMARADLDPQGAIWNKREVSAEFLDRIRMGDFKDRLLVQPQQPQHLNAVNENAAAMLGRPIVAFPTQDHEAHLITHMEYLKSPLLGMNPFMAQKAAPAILNHLREHIALMYASMVYEETKVLLPPGIDPEDLMDIDDEETTQGYDQLMAQVSSRAIAKLDQRLQQFMPDIQKAAQFVQSLQPQQGMDPMAIASQQAQADVERGKAATISAQARQQDVAMKAQLAQQKAQSDQQRLAQEAAAQQADNQNQMNIAILNAQVKQQTNDADNQTAKDLATAEILSGEKVAVSTGTGINP